MMHGGGVHASVPAWLCPPGNFVPQYRGQGLDHALTCCADVMVNTFRSVLALSPADLVAAAYLATGKVAPDYEGMELNVGGSSGSVKTCVAKHWAVLGIVGLLMTGVTGLRV